MTSYSIYRAHSERGIGEGPGRPAVGPDQYVWAAPELWRDQEILDQLRDWMTLKFQARFRFERQAFQEAWSCCVIKGFLFVTRLMLDSEDRYFSHARAWKLSDLKAGVDPGALLGQSTAFDSPTDPFGVSLAPEPRMTWADLLANQKDREATVRFLAHLHASRLARRPMIVLSETFHSNEMSMRALAFSRAALPVALRQECPVRIYTLDTTYFLKNLKAGLVVVPHESMTGVVDANPNVTVMTADGGKFHGPEVDETYAKMVVTRALKFPDALFAYADRCTPGMPVPIARAAYNLAACSGQQDMMDELLKDSLYGSEIPPEIVFREEWRQFSGSALQQTLLRGTGNGHGAVWRTKVLNEMRSRSLGMDPVLEEWWAAQPVPGRGSALLELQDAKVVSDPAARVLFRQLSGLEFVKLGASSAWHRLMKMAGDGPIPEAWATALAGLADPWPTLVGLMEMPEQTAAWTEMTWIAFRDLIKADRLPGRGVIGMISRLPVPQNALGRLLVAELYHRRTMPDAAFSLKQVGDVAGKESRRWVVAQIGNSMYTCLTRFKVPVAWMADVGDLVRGKPTDKAAAAPVTPTAPVPATPVTPASPAKPPAQGGATFATKSGTAVPPQVQASVDRGTAKDKETATPGAPAAPLKPPYNPTKAEQDDEAFMKRIVKLVRPGQVFTSATQTVVDRWMVKDPRVTTQVLLEGGVWSDWRKRSALTPGQLRVCAVNWMLDPAPVKSRAWTDWKQVMVDLAHAEITNMEIDGWLRVKTPPWPWFLGHEEEQARDLSKITRADARGRLTKLEQDQRQEVAAGKKATPPQKAEVKAKAPESPLRSVSDKITGAKGKGAAEAAPEPKKGAEPVAPRGKPPTPETFSFEALAQSPEAMADVASSLKLWQDKTFRKRLAEWLLTKPSLSAKTLEAINVHLPAAPPLVVAGGGGMAAVAEAHLHRGYLAIAEFLSPGITRVPLCDAVVQAMANGEASASVWGELARETESGILKLRPHLLRGVAERIRKADKATVDQLERNGWNALKGAVPKFPVLLSPAVDQDTVLPVLEVACLLRTNDPAVSIALDLVSVQDLPVLALPAWWRELLLGLENLPRLTGRPHPKDSLTNSIEQLSAIAKELSPKAREALTQVLTEYKKGRRSAAPATPAAPAKPAKPAAPPPPATVAPPPPAPGMPATVAKATATVDPNAQKLVDEWIQALLVGDSDNKCWESLAEKVRSVPVATGAEPHPWNTLVEAIRQCEPDVLVQLEQGGWDTLKAVLQTYPDLMQTARTRGAPNAEAYLPVRAIAAALRQDKTKPAITQDLVLLDTSGSYLSDEDWWRSLFRGLHPQTVTSLARVIEGKLKNARAKEAMHKARSRNAT
jgi:hypothetical protein